MKREEEAISRIQRALLVPNRLQGLVLIDEESANMAIEALSADAVQGWIPLSYDDYGLVTDFPYERDGEWVIVTDGKTISVERIKKDAYDHFFPSGRWFELEDVIAWMPLPELHKGGDTE